MAKKGKAKMARQVITLECAETKHRYTTTKNKRNNPARMELKKYNPVLKKHTTYKETR